MKLKILSALVIFILLAAGVTLLIFQSQQYGQLTLKGNTLVFENYWEKKEYPVHGLTGLKPPGYNAKALTENGVTTVISELTVQASDGTKFVLIDSKPIKVKQTKIFAFTWTPTEPAAPSK